MIDILFFFLCLVTSSISITGHGVDRPQRILKEDVEFERELKLLNKPPIKSIHTKFGHVVDCIDINKQPAFDHPLLKNHKLQREPSFQKIIGKTCVKNSPTKPISGLEKDQCPLGTVPIRRTTKNDLIQAKSLLNSHILTQDNPGTHVAQVTMDKIIYGVSGSSSVYNPKVEKGQSSAARLWVQNGPIDASNQIAFGWHVAPQLYNNLSTHVYAMWTTDNLKKTGCFNLLCPGFIQTSKENYLGAPIYNTSVYGGLSSDIILSISQDPITKHWWLNLGNENIGYFPASLFPNMSSADQVGWGGITTTSVGTPSPEMGSGYLPDDNLRHASYFVNIAFRNDSTKGYGPEIYMTNTDADNPDCFDAKYNGDMGGDIGYSLQFGGPGGYCGN